MLTQTLDKHVNAETINIALLFISLALKLLDKLIGLGLCRLFYIYIVFRNVPFLACSLTGNIN